MRSLICATVASLIFFVSAGAEADYVVDFTDANFTVVVDSGINGVPVVFTETVGGATMTFESTVNLVGIRRFINLVPMQTSSGIQIGGGGGSTLVFTVSSDVDMILDSFDGSGSTFLPAPVFDVSGPGASSNGNVVPVASATSFFNGGSILLEANEVYTFSVTNSGATTQGFISSFAVSQPVPEPSGTALIALAGFAVGFIRRRA